jgi:hypothetical protein
MLGSGRSKGLGGSNPSLSAALDFSDSSIGEE